MFSFRVQGFAGSCDSYWSDSPIDVTVFAETEAEAIKKVEAVTGKELSALHRKITTIEAEPVKHGFNAKQKDCGDDAFECSICGYGDWDCMTCDPKHHNYCPNCGAKMDLEGKG